MVVFVKQKYLSAFMDMLDRFAQTSEAERLKVAAVLIKNDNPYWLYEETWLL